jgi:hypothetical protein
MCLMLYLATRGDQPCFETDVLLVKDVKPSRTAVRQWFTLPVVRFVGADTGCSCGFRHVIADAEFDYNEGMFDDTGDPDNAAASRKSDAALVAMIRDHVLRDGEVELFPVWDGDEGEPPLGTIVKGTDALRPETWFFIERFLYRVGRTA